MLVFQNFIAYSRACSSTSVVGIFISVFFGTEGASFAFRLYYAHPPYNWIPQQLKIEPTWLISSIQRDTNTLLVLLSFLFLFCLFSLALRILCQSSRRSYRNYDHYCVIRKYTILSLFWNIRALSDYKMQVLKFGVSYLNHGNVVSLCGRPVCKDIRIICVYNCWSRWTFILAVFGSNIDRNTSCVDEVFLWF
jgi:hypothetical protein